MSFRSGVATLRTAIHLLLVTYYSRDTDAGDLRTRRAKNNWVDLFGSVQKSRVTQLQWQRIKRVAAADGGGSGRSPQDGR